MRVRLALRDAGVDIILAGDKVVLRDALVGEGIDADRGERNLAETGQVFGQQMGGLQAVKGDGEVGVDGVLGGLAGVAVDAAGDVQRKDGGDGLVDHLGDLAAANVDLPVESAAVDGVDDDVHLVHGGRNRFRLVLKGKDRQLHRAHKREHLDGVRGLGLAVGQHDGDVGALFAQLAGDHKAVSAVVALAAEHGAV